MSINHSPSESRTVPRDNQEKGPLDFADLRSQKRELLNELRSSWKEGSPPELEHLLERWPTHPETDSDVGSLLFEDFLQRRQKGEEVSPDEYSQRFPEHKDSLACLISQHALFHTPGGSGSQPCSLRLPELGDEIFGFRLSLELGKGAFARVFLAQQAELADRPVVLKVSAIEGSEPQTLAQLQHTNIVPIYSVHEDDRAGLRAVCMPYFGGASLSNVLGAVWSCKGMPRTGGELVTGLQKIQAPVPQRTCPLPQGLFPEPPKQRGGRQTPLQVLARLNYVQASCWIVARLAEGLAHAHERGVLHRDIKPSNALLSAEGQPLLLDFNVAHDQIGSHTQVTLGGTVAYMSPEHLRALGGRSEALVRLVDERSDIYSLGMVLFEMLTGQRPFDQTGSYSAQQYQIEAMALERSKAPPSLRSHRSDVPWSLESILQKCMAPAPVARYQRAEELAEDLRCLLEDQPLRHALELSYRERLRKWIRRHPRLTSAGSVALAAGLLLGGTLVAATSIQRHLNQVENELRTEQANDRKRAFENGTVRALCLVNTTQPFQDHLHQGLATCEDTLNLYGLLEGDHWQQPADWARFPDEVRRALAEDARELLLTLAWAKVKLASEKKAAVREALNLLDRAEAIEGLSPSRALGLDRANYLDLLGEPDRAHAVRAEASQIPPTTARDHYLLATIYARQGGPEYQARAIVELNEALRRDPRHYWSWLLRGICRLEQGNFVLAAADFGNCTGLWPEFAWGYFNCAYTFDQDGRKAEAIEEYTAALERDSRLAPAYMNRGLARLELKQNQEALNDFDRALELTREDARLHAGRAMALEALGRHQEASEAFRLALAQSENSSAEVRARIRWTYAFAIASRQPEEARNLFQSLLKRDPHHPQALYGLAMLATEQGQSVEALAFFNRALDAHPGFIEARRYRAVLLAREGMLDRAGQDINWCLERQPTNGLTLYAAACVAARAAEKQGDSALKEQALDLLKKAGSQGADLRKAAQDADLEILREDPRFQQLLKSPRPR